MEQLKLTYNANLKSAIHSELYCPICNNAFVKINLKQSFCEVGMTKCRNKYFSLLTAEKLEIKRGHPGLKYNTDMIEKTIFINGIETKYSITEFGDVYSNKFGKRILMKPGTIKGNYKISCMFLNKERYYVLVHRLVATHFIDNPDNKPQVNHIDGNKHNNHFSNLEWVTQSENITHAYSNGLMSKTFLNTKCTLSVADVVEIKRLLKTNIKQREIARLFNVRETTISNIKLNKGFNIFNLEETEYIKID